MRLLSRSWLGLRSSEGLTGAGGDTSRITGVAVGKRPIPSDVGLCRAACCPHNVAAGFLKLVIRERIRRKPHVFYDPASEITVTSAMFYPLEARSLIQSTKGERGIKLHLEGRSIKNMWTDFESTS